MHVTLVSPFDPKPARENGNAHTGGVERVLSNVSQHLADRGHGVTVVCSTDGDRVRRSLNGLEIVRVPRSGTLFRAPIVRLARHVPEDTDLVHVPATYPFTTPTVLKRARDCGVPSVLDFHFEPHPGSVLGRMAARAYRSIATGTYRLAERVLVRSYAYGRSSPSLDTVPEDRWRALPNGIDPNRFHPRSGGQARDYVLFVGRLVPYKGLDVLLSGFAGADLDVPLRIAGDGPLRGELEARARRLDVDAEFMGHVPEDSLPDLYRDAAVTVLPSVNRQEAFGISLLESMACGTPVVASGLPGVADVAREGGLVAPPGDADALGKALEAAIEPGALPEGDDLARGIHETYAWEAVTDRLIDVYDEAASAG